MTYRRSFDNLGNPVYVKTPTWHRYIGRALGVLFLVATASVVYWRF